MKTLGAKLRAREVELGKESVKGVVGKPFAPTAAERRAVAAVWRDAKSRIGQLVRKGGRTGTRMTLGTLTYGVAPTSSSDRAFATLVQACLPFSVPHGLADPRNAFHADWVAFCSWAISEELLPELLVDQHERFVQAKLLLRITALPTTR